MRYNVLLRNQGSGISTGVDGLGEGPGWEVVLLSKPAFPAFPPDCRYLFVLALVALVPAFVFSAVLLQRNNEAQERVVETLITGKARSMVQAVDREINANITTLRVLATPRR